MALNVLRFLSLIFVGIAMSAALAHLMALPQKIDMSAENYLVVQQIYRGWSLLGIAVIGALLSTAGLAALTRGWEPQFVPALIAFLCIAASLAVFFAFTYPANQATQNWTVLPQDWERLRARWEYAHAAGAALDFAAFVALIVAVLARK